MLTYMENHINHYETKQNKSKKVELQSTDLQTTRGGY